MFQDLSAALTNLKGDTTNKRLSDALETKRLPPVSIVGIGGFPIKKKGDDFFLLGSVINPDTFRDHIVDALGQSAILTYLNPKNRTREEFGERCLKDDHLWALNAIPISICFAGYSPFVELSFGRDGSFMKGESWVESSIESGPRIFTVNGSIKTWQKYTKYRNDPSFREEMRNCLKEVFFVLNGLSKDIFKEE